MSDKKLKPVKDKWIGMRADIPFTKQFNNYVESTDLTGAQVLRRAVIEYMRNHPIKTDGPTDLITAPGA